MYRTNLSSAFFGSLSLYLFSHISLPGAILFGLLPQFIKSAGACEVFTLHIFLLFFIISAWRKNKHAFSFFLTGLSLGNQHTVLFLIPSLLFLSVPSLKKKRIMTYLFFFLIGFSVTLFPLVRSRQNPGLNWGNPSTIKRWTALLLRKEFGTLKLSPGNKTKGTLAGISKIYGIHLFRDFGPLLIFFPIGICFLREKKFWFSFLFFQVIFFLYLARPDSDPLTWESVSRFFPQGYIFFALAISAFFENKRKFLYLFPFFLLFPLGKSPSYRNSYPALDYSENILKSIPPGHTLFLSDDVPLFPLWGYTHIRKHSRNIYPAPPPDWVIQAGTPSETLQYLYRKSLTEDGMFYADRKLFRQDQGFLKRLLPDISGLFYVLSGEQRGEKDYYPFFFFRTKPFDKDIKNEFDREIFHRYAHITADRAYPLYRDGDPAAYDLYKKIYLFSFSSPEGKKIYRKIFYEDTRNNNVQ